MITQVWKNFYIISDKNNFIPAIKISQEKIEKRNSGFGMKLSPISLPTGYFDGDEDSEDINDSEESSDNNERFKELGYHNDFISALHHLNEEIIRNSKSKNLLELQAELKEAKKTIMEMLSLRDEFTLIQYASNLQDKKVIMKNSLNKQGYLKNKLTIKR